MEIQELFNLEETYLKTICGEDYLVTSPKLVNSFNDIKIYFSEEEQIFYVHKSGEFIMAMEGLHNFSKFFKSPEEIIRKYDK